MGAPRLIALDWGTSRVRAWLLADGGAPLAHAAAERGILNVAGGGFAAAFAEVCGAWLAQGPLPAIASGMIGSREGWVEAPYAPCPAGFDALTAAFAWADAAPGVRLAIVPGVSCASAAGVPDVMRGEETQVFGALGARRAGTFVLPGTHSKWVDVDDGRIVRFATYMTGELYAVLRHHSILGRLMADRAPPSPDAFRRGWRASLEDDGGLLHRLFSTRTLGLFDRLPAAEAPAYLSGLLIGDEVRAAARAAGTAAVTLIGEPALCELYREPLAACGIAAQPAGADATVHGLWRIATASGVVRA